MSDSLETKLSMIYAEKTNKILPENIKKGIKIFDVEGDLEQGEGSTEIPVKLFASIDEMNNSTGNKEDDLALVYEDMPVPMIYTDVTAKLAFPSTVMLTETEKGNIGSSSRPAYLKPVDSSLGISNSSGSLSATSFRMTLRIIDGSIKTISYTSSDGLTYTRATDASIDVLIVDLGYDVTGMNNSTFNPMCGKFVNKIGKSFSGLYKYNKLSNYTRKAFTVDDVILDTEKGIITVNYLDTYLPSDIVDVGFEKIRTTNGYASTINMSAMVTISKDLSKIRYFTTANTNAATSGQSVTYYNGKLYASVFPSTYADTWKYCKIYEYTIATDTLTTVTPPSVNYISQYTWVYYDILDWYVYGFAADKPYDTRPTTINHCISLNSETNEGDNKLESSELYPKDRWDYYYEYQLAPTQFTDVPPEKLVEGLIAYGANGEVKGTVEYVNTNKYLDCTEYNIDESTGSKISFITKYGKPVCFSGNYYMGSRVTYERLAEIIGLTADKIKAGETILGITGTYEGSYEGTVNPEEYNEINEIAEDVLGGVE